MRRTLALVVAALALASGVLFGRQTRHVSVLTMTTDNSYESCFRRLVNEERAKVHHPLLTDDSRIDAIARRHSDRMAAQGTIFHADSSSPYYPQDDLRREYPPYSAGGENVGMNSDCQSIHDAFMSSPGHRANILDTDYERLGVGVTVKGDDLFVTEDFFTPATAPARRQPSTGCKP